MRYWIRYSFRIMKKLFIFGLILAAANVFAQGLGPGSAAPPIEVKTWVQGKPITALSKKGTYVVEFWATWCGPCREAIPHVNELSKKHKDVRFLGVSIWEDNKNHEVQDFVKMMGPKMTYTVAFGGRNDGMAQTWMAAAQQNGIPAAFIVKDQVIMWVGHPMEIEKPLEDVIAGKFDVAKARKEFDVMAEQAAAEMKIAKAINEVEAKIDAGKILEAKQQLTELETDTKAQQMTSDVHFKLLAVENFEAWKVECANRIAKDEDSRNNLSSFANRNAKKMPEASKWIIDSLVASADKYPANWYPWLNAARVYHQLKDFGPALTYAEKSKQIILDHIKAHPEEPKGNAIDVIEKLIDAIKKAKGN